LAENPFSWSITAADNDDADPDVPWPEGMLPGAVNNGARAIMAAMARLLKDLNGTVATTGSSNTYLATSNCGHSAYVNGAVLTVRANHTNTSTATLNLNSFGAKAVVIFGQDGEAALAGGEIQSGGTYQLRYDSALASAAGAWLLLNPTIVEKVGTIKIWPTNTLPANHLWANGESVSRATYANLFALVGTTYGSADGSSFNLPDLCGRVVAGSDDMGGISSKNRLTNANDGLDGDTLGATGGGETQTLVTANLPAYTPAGTVSRPTITVTNGSNVLRVIAGVNQVSGAGVLANTSNITAALDSDPVFTGTAQGGTSTAFGVVQPTIILNYIIRY
jgi:microcystin-dependent protein